MSGLSYDSVYDPGPPAPEGLLFCRTCGEIFSTSGVGENGACPECGSTRFYAYLRAYMLEPLPMSDAAFAFWRKQDDRRRWPVLVEATVAMNRRGRSLISITEMRAALLVVNNPLRSPSKL